MIRSHDALKRSEEERETLQVVDREVNAEDTPASGAPSSHMNSAPASPGAVISFDTLLARCPQKDWKPDLETMLFLGDKKQTRGTEVFRELRSRLYRVREERRLKTLLVTSALPQEGRSFVAANLAQVMALQPGCKVLLIDADLRSPGLHSALGTSLEPGLGEYLLDELEEFEIMQKGPWDNLFLAPSGRTVAGPSEVLANGRLKALLDRVGPLFDWIIVDSPAAIPVSDACQLAGYCDGILMVVRSHSTPFDAVRKAREKFREEQLVGVVLNGIDSDTSSQSGYY